ncbi:hypothetical protein [Halorubrum ezzemoulense]|uniref:hypothetical protein n=1 Tax=Halorubrum ezzemoulense TaxID=337243 RepID=UPI00232F9B5D|nr:hypothetical protein [Halorubrum ezzemoulense]MDB9233345.1 hypothetical protein [Halorubrum ezzemoulense]
MSSRTSGKHQAHQSHATDSASILRRFVLSLVPLDGFRAERERVANIFAEVSSEVKEVRDAFDGKSNSELQEWSVEPNPKIPEYEPHETVISVLTLPKKALGWILGLSRVVVWVGILLSVHELYSLGMVGLDLLASVRGAIPLSVIVLGSGYLWFLRADTFIHQTLAKELRAGPAKVTSRRRSEIVGYGVWNRSLLGQTGLFLVGFFYMVDSLAHLPVVNRWFDDPAGYVENLITGNIDLLYDADGWMEAVRGLYGRLR